MIYRFTLISDEADDFIREIQIDPEATFYDFHEAIVKISRLYRRPDDLFLYLRR